MSLKGKNVVVTGGSRGLGLGLVEALVDQGANVTVVARGTEALDAAASRLGVATISADITDEAAAHRIVGDVRPDVLVLNAGTTPRMGRLDQLNWKDFSVAWETDVKAGLYWLQAALNVPLNPGSRVLVGSSGAADNGSQMTGGYGGSKRMLWFMAKYANGVSQEEARHPLPGDCSANDDPGHGNRGCGRRRLCESHGHHAGRVHYSFWLPNAAQDFR